MRITKVLAVTSALVLAPLAASQQASAAMIAPGFDGYTLPTCDDCYSGASSLPFTANFFGTSFAAAFVSNNGYITFAGGQSNFTPTGLTSSYIGNPIIAPFYADIDTRGVGTVTYGSGTYQGFSAFGVTYDNVGYYNSHTDKTNTFQLILTNRADTGAGNFDIYFNYNQVQFETGDASSGRNGLGGTSAAAGYANGTSMPGTYYQLPGSLVNGALIDGGSNALVSNTNDGVLGQYLFQVRNGDIVVPPISSGVPEPSTWAMMLLGFAGLAFAAGRKQTSGGASFTPA